jgi:choline-sulfatase
VRRFRRRELLKSAATVGPVVLLSRDAGAASAQGGALSGMSVAVFLTDQERAIQHFPAGWAAENLSGENRLRRYGLTFRNGFTDACMCSPARSTWISGFFPAQHGVKYKLAEYFDERGVKRSVFEMYDRATDPDEVKNLAFAGTRRTREQQWQHVRLRRKLERVKRTRLARL